jgi:hypothetical protein
MKKKKGEVGEQHGIILVEQNGSGKVRNQLWWQSDLKLRGE